MDGPPTAAAGPREASPPSPRAPAESGAGAPPTVFYASRSHSRVFALVSVGVVVVAVLGYVLYDQYSGTDTTTFHDAPTYVLSNTQSFVSQVIDNEALRGFFYRVPYECECPVDGVTVHVPPDVLPDGAVMEVGGIDRDEVPLPTGNTAASALVDVDVAGVDEFNGRLRVTLPIAEGMDASRVVPVAFDRATGTWDAAGAVRYSSGAFTGTVTVEIVQGTAVGLVEVPATSEAYQTSFERGRNGWSFANNAVYLEPGGNALGMSSFAKWLYQRTQVPLASGYGDATAMLLDDRVHLAQSRYWETLVNRTTLTDEASLGVRLAGTLSLTQFPQLLLAGSQHGADSAILVLGVDAHGFTVYDPDLPGQVGRLAWTVTGGFGVYRGHTHFGLAGLTALSAESSLFAYHKSAESGALSSDALMITSPAPGATVEGSLATVSGRVTGALASTADEAVVYVGASRFVVPVSQGVFSVNVPVDQVGTVPIFVLAGPAPAERSPAAAAARTSVVRQAGVAFLVTLTWDQAGTDVDLYVTEPDGETKYFADRVGADGGLIDQDIQQGRGPEHYTLDPTKGHVLDHGDYVIRVHYYSDHSSGLPASGTVSWVDYTDPQRPRSDRVPFYIAVPDREASSPGEWTGPSWVRIATVAL